MNNASPQPPPAIVTSYRKLSLPKKLLLTIVSVATFVTVVSMLTSFIIELNLFKERLLKEYQSTAQLMAINFETTVQFEDERDANDLLASLSLKESIAIAGVYLANGRLLAAYRRNDGTAPTSPPSPKSVTGYYGNSLIISEPISHNDIYLGQFVIKADLDEMNTFITARAWSFAFLICVALFITIILASRLGRHITRPIIELAKTARRITEDHDISTRHQRTSDDETGQLVDAFNEMMTEIERREEALVLSKENAEANSRAKDDFLSVISHELRTPLNPIIGYVEILLRKAKDSDDQKQLGLVKQYAEHLQNLIDRVIDFSRFERGVVKLNQEPVDYQRLCQNVLRLMEGQAKEKGIKLSFQSQFGNESLREKTTLVIDRVKLQQIVLNLVANALKFTQSGGINVLTFIDKHREHEALLRIEVQDTGIGIDNEDREKVFKPFSQIDVSLTRQYAGMGLGLAITQKIVEAMGGQIDFTSEKGSGSTFWVEIPVTFTDEIDPDPSIIPVLETSRTGKKSKVLLVDDQLVNLELGESMLATYGHEVVCARSGKEAIELAQKQSFNLIILDIKMPKMNGYETAEALRKLETVGANTPIIAMTAHITTRGNEQCIQSGMNDFLTKPFNTERLNLIIRKWLDR